MTFQDNFVVHVTVYWQAASEILGVNQTDCETWTSRDYKSTDAMED